MDIYWLVIKRCLYLVFICRICEYREIGSIIAQEASCLVVGSHTAPLDNVVSEEVLTGMKYIVIRAIG